MLRSFLRVGVLILGLSLLATILVVPVFAGSDLTVTCASVGPCTVSPANTPLFDERNLAPGDYRLQHVNIINQAEDTCEIEVTVVETDASGETDLASRMWAAVTKGSTTYKGVLNAGLPTDAYSYRDLYTDGAFTLGTVAGGTTTSYDWHALFDWWAGNEYQNQHSVFDVQLQVTCGVPPTPQPTPTPSSSSNPGNPGGGDNPGGSVQGYVCSATTPVGTPALSAQADGNGNVVLSWSAVSPVTSYAINFGTQPGQYLYGANVGNVTSYTVTGLTPGVRYYFKVLGINDCAPGTWSNEASTPGQTLGEGIVVEAPPGFSEGLVLGEDTNTLLEPQVAGASDEPCQDWKQYIPWILLIAQAVLIIAIDWLMRHRQTWWKQVLAVGVTLGSIGLFYWLRECDCYGVQSFLAWLCRWYWLVSMVMTVLLQVINYAFMEEVDKKPVKPVQNHEVPPEPKIS